MVGFEIDPLDTNDPPGFLHVLRTMLIYVPYTGRVSDTKGLQKVLVLVKLIF